VPVAFDRRHVLRGLEGFGYVFCIFTSVMCPVTPS
jgi:hypothetical protein